MDEEIDNPPLGLDHRGFIRSEVSLAQVRPPYPAAVEALRETCRRTFAELLHRLYLMGSFVKGTARPGQSDVDALAVRQVVPAPEHDAAARLDRSGTARAGTHG